MIMAETGSQLVTSSRISCCIELLQWARMRDDGEKIYCDAEWQADTFAGSLLMSTRHLDRFDGPDEAASGCKMSPPAAQVMWKKYKAEGRIRS
jgi:hypothetical protein